MASVIILAPPSVDSASRHGPAPTRASAVGEVRNIAWRKAADDAASRAAPEIDVQPPSREDDNGPEAHQMGRRALTLTAESRARTWRWDEAPDDEAHPSVGFAAQQIAQEKLSAGAYREDYRGALAAYGYLSPSGGGAADTPYESVSILV
jgi:hypothetical protein